MQFEDLDGHIRDEHHVAVGFFLLDFGPECNPVSLHHTFDRYLKFLKIGEAAAAGDALNIRCEVEFVLVGLGVGRNLAERQGQHYLRTPCQPRGP